MNKVNRWRKSDDQRLASLVESYLKTATLPSGRPARRISGVFWATIAPQFPGRSAVALQSRYNKHVRKDAHQPDLVKVTKTINGDLSAPRWTHAKPVSPPVGKTPPYFECARLVSDLAAYQKPEVAAVLFEVAAELVGRCRG